jgi:glycosyltransferase involved in cell wall biosynthesis
LSRCCCSAAADAAIDWTRDGAYSAPVPAVLQLISSSGLYGAERVLLELACHLHEQGWASHVGALLNRGTRVAIVDEARRRGLKTVLFPCRSGFDTRTMRAIRAYVDHHAIQVAHSHNYKSNIFLFLSGARHRAALVSTCHNWLTDSPKLMVYELLDKLTLHQFNHVVGVSPQLDQELAAAGLPAERRSTIDNGLALEGTLPPGGRDRLRRSLGIPPDRAMLLTIGRLERWKGYDLLLEALARVAVPAHLVLVGEGDLRGALEQQAHALGVAERVTFTGYRKDVVDLLLASDLYVLSSRKEGLPMVLLEAMAAHLPVVATRVGAVPRTLADGEAGLLVPPGDPAALAVALEHALGSPELRRQLAERALRIHEACFSRQAMGGRYVELYQRLIRQRERA